MQAPSATARRDVSGFLWALKLGALLNLYFLANTFTLGHGDVDRHIVLPAQILFAVSAYRCLLPNRYKDNVVLHDSVLSSTFVTRVLATFAEVAFIYQFSHVIRLLNEEHVLWVDALSWLMVAQVVISQFFVWGAIGLERLSLYVYEELGWAVIFVANTLASAWLSFAEGTPEWGASLLQLNLLFGVVYLPWQFIHLRALSLDARSGESTAVLGEKTTTSPTGLVEGLGRSLHERRRATDSASWGGFVGLTWMTAYWATLIPMWVHHVVVVASRP